MKREFKVFEYNSRSKRFEYYSSVVDTKGSASRSVSMLVRIGNLDTSMADAKPVTEPPSNRAGVYACVEEIDGVERETTYWRMPRGRR